jgi:hypothetical protein
MNKTIWISVFFSIAGLCNGYKVFASKSTNIGHSDFHANLKFLTENYGQLILSQMKKNPNLQEVLAPKMTPG